MSKAHIFNIQRYSLHDGPGIRTLFFLKGCSLHCDWCSNPEGIRSGPQVSYNKLLCEGCGVCLNCPNGAVYADPEKGFTTKESGCIGCGWCADHCPTQARTMWGEWIDTSEIVRKAARDKVFYATSGGGITLGGGDPVLQSDAAFAILKESKENGLNTAIETAGYYGFEKLSALLPYCDTLFFDIKAWDPMIHRRVAGGDPEMIKQNIGKTNAYIDAADRKPEWVIRLPILPGYNYRLWDFEPLAEFLKTFGNVTQVEIMPFHNFGVTKYEKLNRDYILKDNVNTQPEEVEDYLKVLIGHGLNAHIMSW